MSVTLRAPLYFFPLYICVNYLNVIMFTSHMFAQSKKEKPPRRSSRKRVPSTVLDKEAVEGERLLQFCRIRAGYTSHVTGMYDKPHRSNDTKCLLSLVRSQLDSLCVAFDDFIGAHLDYVELLTMYEPEKAEECDDYYANMKSTVERNRLRVKYLEHVTSEHRWDEGEIISEDSVSQQDWKLTTLRRLKLEKYIEAAEAEETTPAKFINQLRVAT